MALAPPTRSTIVFSHANGFPAATYRLLFESWRANGHRVIAVPRIGHDPAFPVTNNWPHLRDELLQLIETEAANEQVDLVGHSLGGYLSLLAASKRPQCVRSVLLLDSPVIAGWRAHSIQVAKATGLIRRVSPGRVSRTRRWAWPSAEDALAHFAAKKVFARWDPRVLRDYVRSGTEPDPDNPGAVRLLFRREVETRIYNTLPHHLGELVFKHPPGKRVVFIGGTQSNEVHQVGLAATRQLCQGRIETLPGSHLFPMELPRQTAAAVMRALG